MKLLLSLIAALFVTACASHSQPSKPVNWAEDVDFAALRVAVGWADDYQQRCRTDRPLAKIYDAADADNWQQLANVGQQWLQRCPIDIRVHYMTSMALEKIGQQGASDDHYRWFTGLMGSIIESGNGATPQTAYMTISEQEEYDAMYFLQVRPTSQRLITEPLCNEVHVVDRQGNESVLYFNSTSNQTLPSNQHGTMQ